MKTKNSSISGQAFLDRFLKYCCPFLDSSKISRRQTNVKKYNFKTNKKIEKMDDLKTLAGWMAGWMAGWLACLAGWLPGLCSWLAGRVRKTHQTLRI